MHWLAYVGVQALSWVVKESLKKDQSYTSINTKRLERLRVQRSSYGVPIPVLWGTDRVAGNVIWNGSIREEVATWGVSNKGGRLYRYYATIGIGICDGPIDGIVKIWANNTLIYDVTAGGSTIFQKDGLKCNVHLGTEDQDADPIMVAFDGADDTPAYRGLAYIVFDAVELSDFGDEIPEFEFLVARNKTETMSLEGLDPVVFDGSDADHDNIVFTPDNIFCVIATDNNWFKVNVLSDVATVSRTHDDPQIPFQNSGFDVDESGNVHTIREGDSGFGYFCKLDGDTFAQLATDDQNVRYAYRIRVFRNSSYPYLVAIPLNAGVGEKLRITHRDNYTFTGGPDYIELDPPAGTEWTAISLDDDNGFIWATAAGTGASTESYVVKIWVDSTGTYTQEITDISAQLEKADEIMVDPSSEMLLVGSSSQLRIAGYELQLQMPSLRTNLYFIATRLITHTGTDFYMKSAWRRGVVDGKFHYSVQLGGGSPGPPKVYARDIAAEDWEDPANYRNWQIDDSSCPCYSSGHRGGVYSSLTNGFILGCLGDPNYDYVHWRLDRGGGSPEPLSDVITDICGFVGIEAANLDVSAVTNTLVNGYVVNDRMTARDALQPLMDAYFVDGVDTGGKIKFVLRGGSSVVTISDDDLAAHIAGGDRPQKLVSTRQQELELPRYVEVTYIDPDANYTFAVQRAEKQITESEELLSIKLPLVLDKDEAKQIAVKTLIALWTERTTHVAEVGIKYAYLDPTDVITVVANNVSYTMRINEMQYSGLLLTLSMVETDAASYESEDTGIEVPTEEEEIDYPGPTLLVLIDCPLVTLANNKLGVYVCTLGYTSSWRGSSIFKNETGTWSDLDRPWLTSSRDATIGKATDVLADVTDPWIWDEGSTVNVRLLDSSDSLSSASELNVLNGSNLGILGDEIIQWKTATEESDGSYTLSGLLRGRKGSDWATGSHAIGEYFVLLDETTITFQDMTVDEMDDLLYYRAASFGEHIGSGSTQSFTSEMRSLMPLSVQHVSATRNDSGDIAITWIRRTRINGDWLDGGDVPLGEDSESYSIDIMNGASVVNTLTSSTEIVTYLGADQVTDFGGLQDPVTIKIYQVSATVGRGFETEAEV